MANLDSSVTVRQICLKFILKFASNSDSTVGFWVENSIVHVEKQSKWHSARRKEEVKQQMMSYCWSSLSYFE